MSEVPNSSKYLLVFLRCRTIAFCSITFFSFLWIILLCVTIYLQWNVMGTPQQSTLLVMLAIDTITAIMALILLLRKFRAWLDAARISFLLVVHLGVAAAFAHWSPTFPCPQPTPDDQAVCQLVILYILITSWIIPTLLILYAGGLGFMVFRQRRKFQSEIETIRTADIEKQSIEKKRIHHLSQHSTSIFPPSPMTATPVTPVFALPYAPQPDRLSAIPTPTSASFSVYSASPSSVTPAGHTPTSATFTSPTNLYAIPPIPHHWNSNPPPRSRKYSTTLTESIPEESLSGDDSATSDVSDKRTSARLSKPSPSSRVPSL